MLAYHVEWYMRHPGLNIAHTALHPEAPRGLRHEFVPAKSLDDVACGAIGQATLAEFMLSGAFDRHLGRSAAKLSRWHAALLGGLSRRCAKHVTVNDSRAGMHFVGWLSGWTARNLEALVVHPRDRDWGLRPTGPHDRCLPAPPGLLLATPRCLRGSCARRLCCSVKAWTEAPKRRL
ncbi:MAG: hypothetical protein WA210_06485 [Burkholderiaceae bacterium]